VETNIYQKISEVMKDVEYLKKDGDIKKKDGSQMYTYLSELKITSSIRKSLIKNRLIMYPKKMDSITMPSGMEKVKIDYAIVDIDSKDEIIAQGIGVGQDFGDKAIYKAMTGAFKYTQRQTFMISTGDDPDITSSEKLVEDKKKVRKDLTHLISAEMKRLDLNGDDFKSKFGKSSAQLNEGELQKVLTNLREVKK